MADGRWNGKAKSARSNKPLAYHAKAFWTVILQNTLMILNVQRDRVMSCKTGENCSDDRVDWCVRQLKISQRPFLFPEANKINLEHSCAKCTGLKGHESKYATNPGHWTRVIQAWCTGANSRTYFCSCCVWQVASGSTLLMAFFWRSVVAAQLLSETKWRIAHPLMKTAIPRS